MLRAGGIVRVRALQRIVGGGQVAGAGGKGAQVVQAADKRKRPRARQAAIGGFQAEDAAQRGRHADGSVGVRPQGQRHQPARHGGRAAARGPACDAAGVVRVAARAVMRVFGGEAVGVFVHVQGTDQDRAGVPHPRDQSSVLRGGRIGGVDATACQGHFISDVEQVFDGVGHACQRRQCFATSAACVDGGGFLARAGFGHGGKAVVRGVAFAHAGQGGVQHRQGAAFTAGDLAGDVDGGAAHGRNTDADSSSTGRGSSTKLAAMS